MVEKVGEDVNVFSPSLYKAIDLGLPSGLLWADRNIGAATPEDGGLWSSSLRSSDVQDAWDFGFNAGYGGIVGGFRSIGIPVRGVKETI